MTLIFLWVGACTAPPSDTWPDYDPVDPSSPVCALPGCDWICDAGDAAICPQDCPPLCGDGRCNEAVASCPADCLPRCGDGDCAAPETPMWCPADCTSDPTRCGDGVCEPEVGEVPVGDSPGVGCPDCRCGDGRCDDDEASPSSQFCGLDCPCLGCGESCERDVDSDGDGLFGCGDPDCASAPACGRGALEDCTRPGDQDRDGRPDRADPDCDAITVPEQCGRHGDEDRDGLADCEDSDCGSDVGCLPESVCTDGRDDDGDLLVDCEDDDCWGPDCSPTRSILRTQAEAGAIQRREGVHYSMCFNCNSRGGLVVSRATRLMQSSVRAVDVRWHVGGWRRCDATFGRIEAVKIGDTYRSSDLQICRDSAVAEAGCEHILDALPTRVAVREDLTFGDWGSRHYQFEFGEPRRWSTQGASRVYSFCTCDNDWSRTSSYAELQRATGTWE